MHGIYYRKRKRYDKAEAKFREALNIYPNSYTAKNELAIALQRQGRYLDALHIAKEAHIMLSLIMHFILLLILKV